MSGGVSGFAVTPDDLSALDGYVAGAAVHARSAVSQVQAQASSLFGSGWQGGAASTFRLAWEQWLEGAHAMIGAMESLAELLGAAGGGYDETDAAVRARFAGGAAS